MDHVDPKGLVRRLTRKIPVDAQQITSGRNSRVFRVDCQSGHPVLAKFYFQPTADGRNRLDQEWTALTFMNTSGISNVPVPLARECSAQGAVYSFIEGTSTETVTNNYIADILSFLDKLKQLSSLDEARKIKRAAEACFSPSELINNVENRLARLQSLPAETKPYQHLHVFLKERFSPKLEKCIRDTKSRYNEGLWDIKLSSQLRTLSPSDFGLHNALKTETGFYFVDFEYFGWDDPVKAASDFLLHPAMKLNESQMNVFFSGMNDIFSFDPTFNIRFQTYLPLFCLKWLTILLNEFIPQHFERRKFADMNLPGLNAIHTQQLEKAENLLNKDRKIITALNLRN